MGDSVLLLVGMSLNFPVLGSLYLGQSFIRHDKSKGQPSEPMLNKDVCF